MEIKAESKTVEFLNRIYQNTKKGMYALSLVIEKVEDIPMRTELQNQLEEYTSFMTKVTESLSEEGALPNDSNMMQNVSMKTGVMINTMIDKTPSHIAEMIINGSHMGIIQITKVLQEYSDIEPSAQKLAEELLHMEENRVQRMKKWL